MITNSRHRLSLSVVLLSAVLGAQDLGGGAVGGHNRVARFQLDSWNPGAASQFSFVDLPATAVARWGALSFSAGSLNHPLLSGTLLLNSQSSTFGVFAMGQTSPIALPAFLDGASLYIQGIFLDAVSGFVATDATKVNIFDPVVAVATGIGRTIEVFDERSTVVTSSLTNSRNGRIHFTADRSRAYVTQTNSSVRVYSVSSGGMSFAGSFLLTHRPRSGTGAISPDGQRLYVPVQAAGTPFDNFIAVCDIAPGSPTFNREIGLIPVPVVGPGSGPGNGPMSCAITPDGAKLYIAYAQVLSGGMADIGVLDLVTPGNPFSSIPVSVGGNIMGIHSMEHIEVSEDGQWVYAIEQGFDPALPLINGYTQAAGGALLTVVSTLAQAEIAAIPTGGIGQFEFSRDLLDRRLWIGQVRHDGIAEAACFDIDKHSPTRFSVLQRVQLDPVPYSAGSSGPLGIAVTPDGSRVIVTLDGDQNHSDKIANIDARTFTLLGTTPISAADAETVSVQRY